MAHLMEMMKGQMMASPMVHELEPLKDHWTAQSMECKSGNQRDEMTATPMAQL
jgi:hypothetical protein